MTEFTIDGKVDLDDYNRADCEDEAQLRRRLIFNVDQQQRYFVRFVHAPAGVPGGPCPLDMQEPTVIEIEPPREVLPAPSGEILIDDRVTVADILDYACTDEDGARLRGARYCAQITINANDLRAVQTAGIPLDFDTELPPAVEIATATPSDGKITLTLRGVPQNTNGERYEAIIEHRECGDGPLDASSDSICGATTDFERTAINVVNPLVIEIENGKTYEIRAHLKDDLGNEGPLSDAVTVKAEATAGTLDLYDGAGSQLSCAPSCGTGSGANAALFVAFFALLSRRGRRALTRSAPLAFVAALMLAGSARADFGQTTLGLYVAPYKPNIDSERKADGTPIFGIYDCFFQGVTVLEIGGDVDTHLFDDFGSLQFTVGAQVSQATGRSRALSAIESRRCEPPAGASVELSFLKIRPGLTYRLDPLLDHFGVPLVPYGRLGLIGTGYAFTKAGQFENGTADPVGVRFGWEAAAGMSLALDFMDAVDPFVPDTTKRARASGTFDHTYLFAEAAWQSIDSFGTPGFVFTPIDTFFGTRLPVTWRLGVSVELL